MSDLIESISAWCFRCQVRQLPRTSPQPNPCPVSPWRRSITGSNSRSTRRRFPFGRSTSISPMNSPNSLMLANQMIFVTCPRVWAFHPNFPESDDRNAHHARIGATTLLSVTTAKTSATIKEIIGCTAVFKGQITPMEREIPAQIAIVEIATVADTLFLNAFMIRSLFFSINPWKTGRQFKSKEKA